MSDGIECRVRGWRTPMWSATIGDTTYTFPPGTTREHAEMVIEEAKRIYLRLVLVSLMAAKAAMSS